MNTDTHREDWSSGASGRAWIGRSFVLTHTPRRICDLCVPLFSVVLLVASGSAAAAQDEVMLLTRQSVHERARLVAIGDSTVEVRESAGDLRVIPITELVGFINFSVAIQPPRTGALTLRDGQRYPGDPMPDSRGTPGSSTQIVWDHRWLGPMRFDIEDVDWIAFNRNAARPLVGESDVVILANGDRIEGFVNAIGRTLRIEREDDSQIEIDLNRVHSLRLVNPPRALAEGVHRVWLNNGTVFDATSIRLSDDGLLRLSPAAESEVRELHQHLSMIAGVLFDPEALIPLASLDPHDVEGPPIRYTIPLPEVSARQTALGLRDITLRGPMIARYRIPPPRHGESSTGRAAPARRLLATVRLVHDSSPWPNCEVVIRDDDREVLRVHLDRDTPDAEVMIDLHGSELSIEITEGRHGPVLDHVIIERGMIVR